MKFGLIGFPLSHSFSPKYFQLKFEVLGLDDHTFELFPLQHITSLPKLLVKNTDLMGLTVTIPYKQDILGFLDYVSPEVEAIGACNCLKIIRKKEFISLKGYNTDIIGFEKSLVNLIGEMRPKALILGNGGASKAAQFVLKKLNIDFKIVSRKKNAETILYSDLTKSIIENHKLIINTTSLGTFPNITEKPDIPYNALDESHFLFDMVYNPEITAFLDNGMKAKSKIKNGLEMLYFQADAAWEIWNDSAI